MNADAIATIVNSVICDNTATYGGGVYVNWDAVATITNAVIAGNKALDSGGGLYVSFTQGTNAATLNNVIIAENSSPNADDSDVYVVGSKATLDARNTLSSYSAWNNASADGVVNYVYDAEQPLFNAAANGDYTLVENSQAIDKGNDAYAVDARGNALTTDLAGAARFVGKAVDLGPYEFSPFVPVAPTNVKFGAYDAASKTATLTWTDNAT
ncbi:MAG: hypothetical protein IKK39_15130, partial [Thermoguttaceae bacterium]|nr:hypothetical protein [Thermoguttaceae bacterium]